MARFIFVTGGVVSSLGKGLLSASLGALLQARGFKVRMRKFDPYLNVDPGTMSPYQHGEVYETDDGAETDVDLGHYERLTGVGSRELSDVGVHPEVLLCRGDRPLRDAEREKIALFCNVQTSAVIPALEARNICDVPLPYHEAGPDDEVLRAFRITDAPQPRLAVWP